MINGHLLTYDFGFIFYFYMYLAAIVCEDLLAPVNGRIVYSSTFLDYSTLATYICDTGYGISSGNVIRTCSGDGLTPDGTWTGVPPSCQGITDRFIFIDAWPLLFFFLNYYNNYNYVPSYFSIVEIFCSELDSVANGLISYIPDTTPPFDYRTVAIHTCNEGYFREGNDLRTCTGDGLSTDGDWDGDRPTCRGYIHVLC